MPILLECMWAPEIWKKYSGCMWAPEIWKVRPKTATQTKQCHLLMEMSIFIDISGEHSNVEAAQEPFHILSVEIQTNPPYFQFHWNASKPPPAIWKNIRNACEPVKSERFVGNSFTIKTAILLTKCWICTRKMSNFLFNTQIEKWGRSLFNFLDHFLTFQSHF